MQSAARALTLFFMTFCLCSCVTQREFEPTLDASGTGRYFLPLVLAPGTRLFYMPASVNEHEGTFLLDTGANVVALDLDYALELGLTCRRPPIWQRPRGNIRKTVRTTRIDTLRMGREVFRDFRVAVIDLDHFPEELDGIIGIPVLKHLRFLFDCQNRELVLRPERITDRTLPLKLKDNRPLLEMRVYDKPLEMLVDTGCSQSSLAGEDWSFARDHPETMAFSMKSKNCTIDRIVERERSFLCVPECSIGDMPVKCVFADARSPVFQGSNILGVDIFGEHAVTFDMPAGTIHFSKRTSTEGASDLAYREGLVDSYLELAKRQKEMGKQDEAVGSYEKAIDLQEGLVEQHPQDIDYRSDLAHSYNGLGVVHHQQAPEEALNAYQKAREMGERLVVEDPEEDSYQTQLGWVYNNLGLLREKMGVADEALAWHQKAIEVRRRLVKRKPDVPGYREELGSSYSRIAKLQTKTGCDDDALISYQEAIAHREALVAHEPAAAEHQDQLAGSYYELGGLQRAMGKRDEACASYKEAIELRERLVVQHPDVVRYRRGLAASYYCLGREQRENGSAAEATAAYLKAVVYYEMLTSCPDSYTETRKWLAHSHHELGMSRQNEGELSQARDAYQKAIAIRVRLVAGNPTVGEHRNGLAWSYNNLGNVQKAMGGADEAANSYRQAIEVREKAIATGLTVREYRSGLATTYVNLGKLQRDTGYPEEALLSYEKAVEVREELAREDTTSTAYWTVLADTHYERGNLQRDIGKRDEAVSSYEQAVEQCRKAVELSPEDGRVRGAFGWYLYLVGRYDESLAESERAIRTGPKLAFVHANIGLIHAIRSDLAQAMPCYERVVALKPEDLDRLAGADLRDALQSQTLPPAGVHYALAFLYETQDNRGAAREHYQAYIDAIKEGEFSERARQRLAQLAE